MVWKAPTVSKNWKAIGIPSVIEFYLTSSKKKSLSCSPYAFESIRNSGRKFYTLCVHTPVYLCYSQFESEILPTARFLHDMTYESL